MAFSAVKIIASNLIPKSGILKQSAVTCNRLLYTRAALGVTGYDVARENHKKQFTNLEESFRNRMRGFLEKPDSVIFSEDLKAMVYLCEKNPEDLDLVLKMIKKYNKQKNELRFSNFMFGPIIMRAFYCLDEPDLAFKTFIDPEFGDFFNQLSSLQIVMDLLWNNGRYEDCLQSYDSFIQRTEGVVNMFPRNAAIIVAAACYKMNTPESLEKGLDVMKTANARLMALPRRGSFFIAALALKQNMSHVAYDIVYNVQKPNYITVRCVKAEAYIQLKRFDDLLILLKNSTLMENPTGQKQSYYSDTFQKIEDAVKAELDEESELVKLVNYMKESGHVQDLTMEAHLCSDIGEQNVDNNKKIQGRNKYNQKSFRFDNIINNTRFGAARN